MGFFQRYYFGGSPVSPIVGGCVTVTVALELVVGVIVSAALSAVLDRFVLNRAPQLAVE